MEEKSKNTKKAAEQKTVHAKFSAELIKKEAGKIETKVSIEGTTMDLLVLTYALISNIAEQTGLTEEAALAILKKVGTKLEKNITERENSDEEKLRALLKNFLDFLMEEKKENKLW